MGSFKIGRGADLHILREVQGGHLAFEYALGLLHCGGPSTSQVVEDGLGLLRIVHMGI